MKKFIMAIKAHWGLVALILFLTIICICIVIFTSPFPPPLAPLVYYGKLSGQTSDFNEEALKEMRVAIYRYYQENRKWPSALDEISKYFDSHKIPHTSFLKEIYLFEIKFDTERDGKRVEKELNKKIISDKIRKVFKEKGCFLKEPGIIKKVDIGRWEIEGKDKIYIVRIERWRLSIYEETNHPISKEVVIEKFGHGHKMYKSTKTLIVHTKSNQRIHPSQITDEGGWIYSPDSGDIRINCSHKDSKGVYYYEW
ncbi:MAG: peptidylprolyl isomerase [bacterium]